MKKKTKRGVQRSCDHCKGEGGEGWGVANGHMTVRGQGGRGGRGRGGAGGKGGQGKRRKGRRKEGARQGGEEDRGGPAAAARGPTGPPLWARRACHCGPVQPVTPGLVRPATLGPPF